MKIVVIGRTFCARRQNRLARRVFRKSKCLRPDVTGNSVLASTRDRWLRNFLLKKGGRQL